MGRTTLEPAAHLLRLGAPTLPEHEGGRKKGWDSQKVKYSERRQRLQQGRRRRLRKMLCNGNCSVTMTHFCSIACRNRSAVAWGFTPPCPAMTGFPSDKI